MKNTDYKFADRCDRNWTYHWISGVFERPLEHLRLRRVVHRHPDLLRAIVRVEDRP